MALELPSGGGGAERKAAGAGGLPPPEPLFQCAVANARLLRTSADRVTHVRSVGAPVHASASVEASARQAAAIITRLGEECMRMWTPPSNQRLEGEAWAVKRLQMRSWIRGGAAHRSPRHPQQRHSYQAAVDPRTGLPLAQMPAGARSAGALCSAALLFVARVTWFGAEGRRRPDEGIVVVTDADLLLCQASGSMLRALPIREIADVVIDDPLYGRFSVGVRANSGHEYDFLFELSSNEQRAGLLAVLKRVSELDTGTAPTVDVAQTGIVDECMLRLHRPERWRLRPPKLTPVRTFRRTPAGRTPSPRVLQTGLR
eukprot:TRINITY_DN11615_c0_g2_i1.p1 TRINITY_DN11615_c0_g2~~TRINITY_DN11615_c0_g2_i1.p1  ORF type:complete len:315 (+),score=100.63 TRINITY_DN11615_c0_g2_i1:50-994(+)